MKKPNRTVLFAVPGLIAALFLSSCGLFERMSSGTRDRPAGTIGYLEGSVLVNGRSADVGTEVMSGDEVVTSSSSFAEIEFGSYRILRIAENSRMVIDADERTFRLDRGGIAVVQSKARGLSGRGPWLVETSTTVAAVRGTVYYVRVESPDSTYFCLCNGRITLTEPLDGGVLNLEAAHHRAVRFVRDGGLIVAREAPMIYHDDESVETLADRVHVPIDWTSIPE